MAIKKELDTFQGNDRPTIHFSEQTWFILNDDREKFSHDDNPLPLSVFLNQIFLNFYKEASCSLSTQFENDSESFSDLKEKIFTSGSLNSFEPAQFDMFKSAYLANRKKELAKKVPVRHASPSDHPVKVRLNQTVKNELTELKEKEAKDKFYVSSPTVKQKPLTSDEKAKFLNETFVKMYLEALFEEYASLASFRREEIYAKEVLDEINKAKNAKLKVKITLAPTYDPIKKVTRSRVFHVSPYKLAKDPANLYTYLAGYSQELVDGELQPGKPASIRLSRIIKTPEILSRPSALSAVKKKELDEAISKRGVQFLTEEAKEIKVRFTKKGLAHLKAHLYLRPIHRDLVKGTDDTYTFTCTEVQAMNYFFKFGKHAYIVEPDWLRKKFKKRYLESYKSYLENEKLEITENEQLERYTEKISKLKEWLEEE